MSNNRQWLLTLLGTAALVPLLILGFDAAAADGLIVSQKNRAFKPGQLELVQGDTLTIVNDDEFIHHAYIKSDNFNYDSGEQALGARIPIRLTAAGTFEVRCAIHPKMHLTLVVRPAG